MASLVGDANREESSSVEVFVPGRVCLLGEHSDWSGGFRRFNSAIVPGSCLVCGTNQGLYARTRRHPDKLVVTSTNEQGDVYTLEHSLDADELLATAREGEFAS